MFNLTIWLVVLSTLLIVSPATRVVTFSKKGFEIDLKLELPSRGRNLHERNRFIIRVGTVSWNSSFHENIFLMDSLISHQNI